MKVTREQAIQSFISLDRLHKTTFDRVSAATGLHRSQHLALMCIMKMPSGSNQNALASEMNVSPAAIAKILRRLEESGHVRRCVDSDDRRISRIEITDKGKEAVEEMHQIFRSVDMRMFEGMSDEMMTTFAEAMTLMRDNLCKLNEDLKGGYGI